MKQKKHIRSMNRKKEKAKRKIQRDKEEQDKKRKADKEQQDRTLNARKTLAPILKQMKTLQFRLIKMLILN